MKVPKNIFKAPICALRERLGLLEGHSVSQQETENRLGCSHGAYRKWEEGKAIPRGDWMLKLLALCPDEETRALFTQATQSAVPVAKPAHIAPAPAVSKGQSVQEMLRNNNYVIQALQDMAASGDRSADEALRAMAETLARGAHLATRPDREQRRKANLNDEGINHHRDS